MKKAAFAAFLLICHLLEALIPEDSVCTFRHSLNVETFVLLHKLEMQQVALREAIDNTIPDGAIVRLIREIMGLHKGHAALSFQDAGVGTIEIVGIGPFSGKLGRILQVV